jgi:hypothetical protein
MTHDARISHDARMAQVTFYTKGVAKRAGFYSHVPRVGDLISLGGYSDPDLRSVSRVTSVEWLIDDFHVAHQSVHVHYV